ncbi:MAG: type II toxin-antitoxin system VapC family toxin [Chloroflexales bacterium]|nr:type II toxin-antitoxin system VapC family toxin [Chloroflexales bacterium]
MNYLLDTNVISELVAKQPNQKVVDWIDGRDPDTVYLSVITIGELRKGVEKLPPSKRRDALMDWLTTDVLIRFQGRIAAITIEVMLTWGQLTGQLEQAGLSMAAVDSFIAAIAREGGYTLVTRNEADFQHTGVAIVNPWQ